MKNIYYCFTFLFILIALPTKLLAQKENNLIHFSQGNFKIDANINKQNFKKENIKSALYGTNYFLLIHFSSIPSALLQEELKVAGIKLETYVSNNSYFAVIKKDFDFSLSKIFNITAINKIAIAYKIDKSIINVETSIDKDPTQAISVSFSASINKEIVIKELLALGANIVPTRLSINNVVFVQANQTVLTAIAELPFVTYISVQNIKATPLNYNDIAMHGASGFNEANGNYLNGKGVTIGVGDQGDISLHTDFAGRVFDRVSASTSSHSTHVSGTAAGAGIIDIRYHGLAPHATIISNYFSDIIFNAPAYITDNDMLVTNNSYTQATGGCAGEQAYDVLSSYIDYVSIVNDQLLHVFASGNDGNLTCAAYPNSYGTLKSGWQTAKNVLTVGAMNYANYTIGTFSSSGPAADGRIKPEVVTNGTSVISSYPYNNYGYDQGTSMATPVVSGSVALLCQRYRQLHVGADPKSVLIKAIICNSAEDMGNPGPDYRCGFGMLNVRRAVNTLNNNWYTMNSVANGANNASTITLPTNARRLKVMLYWADVQGSVSSATTLVNDLDLTVTTPTSLVHYPFILNPAPANVANNAVEGADHTNNIEQVTIENPIAGIYNINVSGYAVPYGPQPYAIAYEIMDSAVHVEYPFGGETLVPGDLENLRWSCYGDETSNYTAQYSLDNGTTWTLINNNIPAASHLTPWTVPTTTTNTALVKISRNGSGISGQSTFNFTILGRPVVVDTVMCQGYVKLNWAAIPGATSYDILQLIGDSMQVIGNTTAITYLVNELNKYQSCWLGVRAKAGTVVGRRSVSLNVIPNGGACTLTNFNNDLIVDSIVQPNTARQYFANAGNASAPVTITIHNLGSVAIVGPFNASYKYATTTVTEIVNTTIPAGGTYTYTFTTPFTFASTGFHYQFEAWATNAADPNHANDTAYKVVKLLANPVITTLPVTESFETVTTQDYMYNVLGLDGDDAVDFSASTLLGRARPFINTGFALSGKKAMTLDQSPYNSSLNTDSLTISYNLSAYTTAQLRYDFFYSNQFAQSNNADKFWVRGSENDPWIVGYDIYANAAPEGAYKHVVLNINTILNSAIPVQVPSATFQVRFGESGNSTANTPNPENVSDNGYTFDSLTLNQVINDVALTQIISPDKIGCDANTTPVTVTIQNLSNSLLNNVMVNYQLNNGAIITETVNMPANATINYTFTTPINFASFADNTLNAWVYYPSDSYHINDSILNYTFHNSPVINTFPYLEGFETSNGYFYTGGTNSSWQWGTPNKPVITKAANGNNCWTTNLTGNYKNNETSYLYSPCFDLSTLAHPMLSFSHIFQIEPTYDFTWVEYSTDGINWQKLGLAGSGTNWYDDVPRQNWLTSNTIWHVASSIIPSTATNVKFRFVLTSDQGVNYAGIGIDDIHIFDSVSVYTGAPISSNTQIVNGNNWVDFTAGGEIIASVNANGMNLGVTNVQVYPQTGITRTVNNNYYLNRNIVVTPTNIPSANVNVRMYFTDSEANNLITASGCSACITPPASAYQFGITKYSGLATNENGTLSDNLGGNYLYIPRTKTAIIPFCNGYYTQFDVTSFSEIWIDSLGFPANVLPVKLISFTANKKVNQVLLQWITLSDIGTANYTIERSGNGSNYISIGQTNSNNSSTKSQYNFIDVSPLSGNNFYRLKMIDADGTFVYSPVQLVTFVADGDGVWINPNPIINGTANITSLNNLSSALLIDASGKQLTHYTLNGKNCSINVAGFAKGLYTLKVFTETMVTEKRLIIE